jgi:hypothetical protein
MLMKEYISTANITANAADMVVLISCSEGSEMYSSSNVRNENIASGKIKLYTSENKIRSVNTQVMPKASNISAIINNIKADPPYAHHENTSR